MVDWLINDDGIRVPHVGSEPSSPTAGSTLFGFRTRRTKRLVKLMETFNPI
jgi:hypothetical protein